MLQPADHAARPRNQAVSVPPAVPRLCAAPRLPARRSWPGRVDSSPPSQPHQPGRQHGRPERQDGRQRKHWNRRRRGNLRLWQFRARQQFRRRQTAAGPPRARPAPRCPGRPLPRDPSAPATWWWRRTIRSSAERIAKPSGACEGQLGDETAAVREALRAFAELGTAVAGGRALAGRGRRPPQRRHGAAERLLRPNSRWRRLLRTQSDADRSLPVLLPVPGQPTSAGRRR